MKKVYIAGKITGKRFYKLIFLYHEIRLRLQGYSIMNPATMRKGFTHEEYMRVCYAMIDVCDTVCFMKNWAESKGAKMELNYAIAKNKKVKWL